jgi:hypothetical protein
MAKLAGSGVDHVSSIQCRLTNLDNMLCQLSRVSLWIERDDQGIFRQSVGSLHIMRFLG